MSSKLRSIERKAKANELKITLGNLLDSKQGLTNLCAQVLPAKIAFLLSKTLRAANTEYQSFDSTLKSLCERFGEESEGGYKIKPEHRAEFDKEMDDLLATEVTLPDPAITLNSLNDAKLSALDLAALDWLVSEK